MTKVYQVIHKKSNVLNSGQPKLPSASTLEYGEIAINYAKGGETLSIKNANDEVVTFSSDEKILSAVSAVNQTIEENEMVVAEALNDLNERISGVTVPTKTSDLSNDSGFITSADTQEFLTSADTQEFLTSADTQDFSLTSHTHSEYSLTGHTHSEYLSTSTTIPTTAAEVGAMATSERSNYLATGSTLDDVADGTTRKLSDYSQTGHTHSEYLTTATTIPTESSMVSSGFTKNAVTGITYNGTAVTVTDGVAAITAQTGEFLPTVSSSDNGKVLMVVNGVWSAVTPTVIYTGTGQPSGQLGNDGDIYIQTS